MKAVLLHKFGDASQLYIGEVAKPTLPLESDYILVKVKAAAVNRADVDQREGNYPPPSGASDILGVEISGVVEEIGIKVTKWKVGDHVMSLLGGGGYAEYVIIPSSLAIRKPDKMSFEDAASIPEAYMTAIQSIYWHADLKPTESILIHAAASGVGVAAIQLSKLRNAKIFAVAGSAEKLEFCKHLGAHEVINYKKELDWMPKVVSATNNKGVDVIIDCVGASAWHSNLNSLAVDGRMVMLATLGGKEVDKFDVGILLRKRITVKGSTLRSRTLEYKALLANELEKLMPMFESGQLRPVVDKVFQLSDVKHAHEYMENNLNKGKIVLRVD